ncbi:ankyrin repeat domain-containing protein 6 [Anabrus simplex]|uniref:ankyrin repeat domain-containing protein 6 n=1 Tax=Anabrus simplex TaxID=316456 RepID=UPI0035A31521
MDLRRRLAHHCNSSEISSGVHDDERNVLVAVLCDDAPSLQRLLEEGRLAKRCHDETPLHLAARIGSVNCLISLLRHNMDVDCRSQRDDATPLHTAAQHGQSSCVEALVKVGADVRARDRKAHTPVFLAALHKHSECVKILLEAELTLKELDVTSGEWNLLHVAASNDDLNTMRVVLEHRQDLLDAQDLYGRTALHVAAEHGHQYCLRLLLEYGANLDVVDNEGYTALRVSQLCDDFQCSRLLQDNCLRAD